MDSIQEYYEDYWECRKGIPGSQKPKLKELLKHLPLSKATIVDYGCGAGQFIREMKKVNPKGNYIGIDISQKALDMAASHLENVHFIRTDDGAGIPLEHDSVDFMVASEVLEHVFHVSKTLDELWKVLKPDGRIWISVPFHGTIKNLLIAITNFDEHFDPLGRISVFFQKKASFEFYQIQVLSRFITAIGEGSTRFPGIYIYAKKAYK